RDEGDLRARGACGAPRVRVRRGRSPWALPPADLANAARGAECAGVCAVERPEALEAAPSGGATGPSGRSLVGEVVRRLGMEAARRPGCGVGAARRGRTTHVAPGGGLAASRADRSGGGTGSLKRR